MKKSINNFSRLLCALMLCACLMVTGCYDHSALQEQIGDVNELLKDHESRLKELERLTAQQNTNISSLQTILTALQDKDYVTNIAPITEGREIIGYTITFSKSGNVTIFHGTDGMDGANGDDGSNGTNGIDGKDGHTPQISVKQDTDEVWYWTVDGEWLLTSDGAKVVAVGRDGKDGEDGQPGAPGNDGAAGSDGAPGKDGVTPKLKIEDGYWYVSYDNGKTWETEPLGQATGDKGEQGETGSQGPQGDQGAKGDSIFKDIDVSNNGYILLTLSDNQVIKLPTSSLEENVSQIMSMIQSLTFLSEYPDAIVDAQYFKNGGRIVPLTSEFNYVIRPISAAERLAEVGSSAIKVEAYYTRTKAAFDFIELPVMSVTSSGSVLTVTVSLENLSDDFFEGATTASAHMIITDGRNDLSSDIVKLVPTSFISLSANGTANSYIVSKSGAYQFTPTKGNSTEPVGAISKAEVLWETFGTDETPNVGDLVKNVKYDNGQIFFQTADSFKEGNAVIAARDASGSILWSWHIWFTDQPQGQEYYNNAGTMMDRNLGATSATPGDVGALGLLYQWGRKDPFLGSPSIHNESMAEARSTITWPSAASSNSSIGTIEYATANPTIFITRNDKNCDWYYTGSSSTDNTRWTTSDKTKSIYDPCPSGWRVPDGGSTGVWAKAIAPSDYFDYAYDSTNKGMNLSGKFGSDQTIWYPASGFRGYNDGSLYGAGGNGFYWSASIVDVFEYAYYMGFDNDGIGSPSGGDNRATGYSVRCLQVID